MDLPRSVGVHSNAVGGTASRLPTQPMTSAWWRLAAGAVVLLAFLLRMVNLGGQSLWYDEAFSLLMARYGPLEIVQRTALDTMPPLYYWLLHIWGTGPPADFYPRFISVLAGTLSIALVYAVARMLFDARTGAVAALFTAVAPFHVFYSQEVRMYTLLGVWTLLATLGFLLGWHRGDKKGWPLFALGTALALYTHALGGLPSLSLLVWAALQSWRRPKRLAPPLLALGGAFILYLPWSTVLAVQTRQVFSSFWTGPPSVVSPLASLYLFYEGPFAGNALFPWALAALLSALGLTLPPLLRTRGSAANGLGLLWAWALFPLLALLALSLFRPIYLERVVIGAAFPVYILLAWATLSLRPPWWGKALGGLVLALGLWSLLNWYGQPAFGKPPLQEAARVVQRAWQPGEPVLHTSDGSMLPFLLYAPDVPNRLLLGDPEYYDRTARARSTYEALAVEPVTQEVALEGARRFFLVIALDHSVEYQLAAAEQLDGAYQRLDEVDVGGIKVRTYQRR